MGWLVFVGGEYIYTQWVAEFVGSEIQWIEVDDYYLILS